MIGSAVTDHLISERYEVFRLVRRQAGNGEVRWDPEAGTIDTIGLEGFDSVVHLASMPWPLRWTARFKKEVHENRIRTNRLLAESLARCKHKPRVLICASGMGFYPSSGNQIITEDSPAGTSFLATLQRDGEAVTAPASNAGIRVVHLRIPPVLEKSGIQRGARQMGNGRQWLSWVGLDELARIVLHVLVTEALEGPVNPVSPNPMPNAEFARVVACALGRKAGPAIPASFLRLMLGEMANELILASRRIEPRKLILTGYQFRFPKLETALRHELQNNLSNSRHVQV